MIAKPSTTNKKTKKPAVKSVKTPKKLKSDEEHNLTQIEDNPNQVLDRLNQGCECKESCFIGLSHENVYKHRLNIAELTKDEHDMYLMGVTMACLANRSQTIRHKERVRQRTSYVYQGKRVCLDAFLYLENVTHYHLKRIRTHVMTVGVSPRVHGNLGKKPHNTFSLDMYKNVEMFLKKYLNHHTNDLSKHFVIYGETRANIYNSYKLQEKHPEGKIMGFSTFRHFMKKQFPNVKFSAKIDKFITTSTSTSADKIKEKQKTKTEISNFNQRPMHLLKTDVDTFSEQSEEEEENVLTTYLGNEQTLVDSNQKKYTMQTFYVADGNNVVEYKMD